MVCTTLGTIKQAPKPSRISREVNAHVVHASPVQLQAKGRVRNVKKQVLKLNSFITVACYLC